MEVITSMWLVWFIVFALTFGYLFFEHFASYVGGWSSYSIFSFDFVKNFFGECKKHKFAAIIAAISFTLFVISIISFLIH